MSKISVIMCTKNRINKLEKALNSLKNQTFKDFELVIVNDGGDSIKNFINDNFKELNIKLIERESSKGAAFARNLAMDNANGEYFAFLDDDDFYFPDHLENAMNFMMDNKTNFSYCSTYISRIRSYDLNEIKKGSILHSYDFNQDLFKILCFIPMSSVVIKATNLRFDEKLPVCEDWEFWVRLTLNGYTPILDKRISTVYFRVPSEASFSNNALIEVKNYMFFYNCWKQIIERNKNENIDKDKVQKVVDFHEKCIKKLQDGKRLPHFYFENFTKLFIEESDLDSKSFSEKIDMVL